MSKDSSAGGGASVGLQELLRMNPDLMGQLQQGAGPSPIEQAMAPPPMLPADFYGSGTEITQPDMAYYESFPLPSSEPVQAEVPAPTPAPARTAPNIPIFDFFLNGQGQSYDSRGMPAGLQNELELAGQQYARSIEPVAQQEIMNDSQAPTPPMPILDMAGGQYRPTIMPTAGAFIPEPAPQVPMQEPTPQPIMQAQLPELAPNDRFQYGAPNMTSLQRSFVQPDFRNFNFGIAGL
jgi:hypothetical protein